jgi:cullin-associated NEDD8-dissociated protein 1
MSSQIPQNPTSQTVAQLLPKLTDVDPDYRFMSLNDLFQVLNNGKQDFLYNDYNTAARAVDGILKTLDDQNGEVQNLAIKWYAGFPILAEALTNTVFQSRPACQQDPQQYPSSPY